MYKKSKNPQVEQITKSFTGRIYATSSLNYLIREDGSKGCIWCGDTLKSRHATTRYCKDGLCMQSAFAWSNPQKENGLWILLQRQDFCCNVCKYDYKPFIEERIVGKSYGTKTNTDYKNEFNFYILKNLKSKIEKTLCPEVDHIVPIYRGGQSLGLENHQVICYGCHKIKSKVDNSGKRPPKTPAQKKILHSNKIISSFYQKLREFNKEYGAANPGKWSYEMYDNALIVFFSKSLTDEELLVLVDTPAWKDRAEREIIVRQGMP